MNQMVDPALLDAVNDALAHGTATNLRAVINDAQRRRRKTLEQHIEAHPDAIDLAFAAYYADEISLDQLYKLVT